MRALVGLAQTVRDLADGKAQFHTLLYHFTHGTIGCNAQVPCLPGRKVIQVLFGNEQLVACAEDHHLAFMNRIGDLVAGTGNL